MKNIALIISSLQGGGAERCAADLSIYFSKKGYRVYILTDVSRGITYEYSGTIVDYMVALNIPGRDGLEKKVNELKQIKAKYEIDISISFLQLANYLNIMSKEMDKVILTTHSLNSEYAKYEKGIHWEEETCKELFQFADIITFPSEYCKKDWISHYGDANHILRTVYNPVHAMENSNKHEKENIIIAIGRMHAIKRQWHILNAFREVKKKCTDCKLVILGDGELRKDLEKQIRELGLEDAVELPGNVRNVQDYLEKAKVFVITSRCEAMPCSVLEAMSAGVPVVACDIPGGIREELGLGFAKTAEQYPVMGRGGILTSYIFEERIEEFEKKEEELANEIIRLLDDDKMREQFAEDAIESAQRFTIENIGNMWVREIFENCLDRSIDREQFEKVRQKNYEKYSCSGGFVEENMHVAYFRLLEKWMILKENKRTVQEYFNKHNKKQIVIYGMGIMAKHLLHDLAGSQIKVLCAIDRAAINKYGDFPIVASIDQIPEADCIVVTPTYDFASIKSELEKKTKIPVISLREIVENS